MANIKCLVWDLDQTLWSGVLLEGDNLTLRPGVLHTIVELDRRGVLQSIASRNDERRATEALEGLGVLDYFVVSQITWGSKSASMQRIASTLNISTDTLAFIDDDPFELGEVADAFPEVLGLTANDLERVLTHPAFPSKPPTIEATQRRAMYQAEMRRRREEQESGLARLSFLRTLDLTFDVRAAVTEDIARAHELTVRTNQLNTTGIIYNEDALRELTASDDHLVLVASLADRYGTYGTIGLAVIEMSQTCWTLKLLLTSCRVVSRGAGTLLLNDVMRRADRRGVQLAAEMVPTDRNRMMTIALRLAGFQASGENADGAHRFIATAKPPNLPNYVRSGGAA